MGVLNDGCRSSERITEYLAGSPPPCFAMPLATLLARVMFLKCTGLPVDGDLDTS